MHTSSERSGRVHVELLSSVFATLVPAWIMSALFTGVGAVVAGTLADTATSVLYAIGVAATAARMAVTMLFRTRFVVGLPDPADARAIERWFGTAYVAFGVALGAFAARALWIAPDRIATVVVVLVVGYAAGVSAGVALRPRIGVASMTCAVVPAILAIALRHLPEDLVLATAITAFFAGGLRSTLIRYRAAVEAAGMRHTLAGLARTDPLTGLANRLALAEHMEEAARRGRPLAVRCVDLDDFKRVNDELGHPAGDAVLVEAAARLRRLGAGDGLVARIGGDEFVLVQPVDTLGATALSMQIAFAMDQPYTIGTERVAVRASVGGADVAASEDMADALARADQALYSVKRGRAAKAGAGRAPRPAAFVIG